MIKQTALITGANKGIGLETSRNLARAGYRIFLGSRDKANGEKAIEQLKAEGLDDVELVMLDVTSEQSVQQAHEAIKLRAEKLDVLINNAGIRGRIPQLPSTIDDDTMKKVFETNFFGAMRVTRIFMDLMQKAEVPRIVNVTSDLASLTLHSDPSWEYYSYKGAAYGPSKTALNAYTVALAYELRDTAFKVNAVNPGHTATDFNHYNGTKDVAEAAELIARYAMLDASGPTGKYFSDYGETPW